jgi:hypothetical protein
MSTPSGMPPGSRAIRVRPAQQAVASQIDGDLVAGRQAVMAYQIDRRGQPQLFGATPQGDLAERAEIQQGFNPADDRVATAVLLSLR